MDREHRRDTCQQKCREQKKSFDDARAVIGRPLLHGRKSWNVSCNKFLAQVT